MGAFVLLYKGMVTVCTKYSSALGCKVSIPASKVCITVHHRGSSRAEKGVLPSASTLQDVYLVSSIITLCLSLGLPCVDMASDPRP